MKCGRKGKAKEEDQLSMDDSKQATAIKKELVNSISMIPSQSNIVSIDRKPD